MTFFDCAMMIVFAVDIIFTVKKSIKWPEIRSKLSPEQIKAAFAEKRMRIGRIFGHFSAAIHRRKNEIDSEIETDQSAENRS